MFYKLCPYCGGKGGGCPHCHGTGQKTRTTQPQWLPVMALALILSACTPTGPGKFQGPQNPGVLVNDARHCTAIRSPMLDMPAPAAWQVGCR